MRVRHVIPRLMDPQRRFVRWEPPAEAKFSRAAILSASYGTGKSLAAAARFARMCMAYGRQDSYALVTAPVARTLDTTLPAHLEKFFPPGFIRSRRKPHGSLEWVLQNGQHIVFWSGKSYVDSIDAWLIWVDEVHDGLYRDHVRWDRLIGRFRGPAPHKHLICSGIAIDDASFRARFDAPEDPCALTVLPGLKDSWVGQRDPTFLERAVAGKERRVRDALINGGWVPPAEGAFPDFDWSVGSGNIVDAPIDAYIEGRLPVHVSLDPGEQFGVLIVAPWRAGDGGPAVLALQSWCFDRYSTEQVLNWLKSETDYRIEKAYVDTDAQRDVRVLIQQAMPHCPVESIQRSTKSYRLAKKLERFRWAICDGNGVRRFFLHQSMLSEGRRGLAKQIEKATVKDDGTLTKPNDEHVRDCAMYAVQLMLPERETRPVDYSIQDGVEVTL